MVRQRRAGIVLGILVLLASALVGRPGAAASTHPPIAVLGIWEGQGRHAALSRALLSAARAGYDVRGSTASTKAEGPCLEPECLIARGQRLGVDLIVAGHLLPSRPQGSSERELYLFVFDVQRRGPTSNTLHGTEEELEAALPQELARLLQQNAEPIDELQPPSLVLNRPSKGTVRERSGRLARTALASGLGVISALSLTGAIVAHALHNQTAPGVCDDAPDLKIAHDQSCTYQTTPLFATGYSVAAGSLIGLVLVVAIP